MKALRLTIVAWLAATLGTTVSAQEDQSSGAGPVVASREYIIQQEAGETIIVRVSAFEAEFTSRVSTEEGELIVESGVPRARTLPVWQYIPESGEGRQIHIQVNATQVTADTEFELDFTRLDIRDSQTAQTAGAYRSMAYALESLPNASAQDWTVKINTIIGAGRLFNQIGINDLAMWCEAFAAHLVLFELRDLPTAFEMADVLLTRSRLERFPEIRFAALKVRTSALIELKSPQSLLQSELADLQLQARSLDYRFEEASALLSAGILQSESGQYALALDTLNRALELAQEIQAFDLATAIRERILEILESQGNEQASGQVLQDIETQLLESGEEEELARNLLQQGRLHINSHDYREAIITLNRATRLESSVLTGIQLDLELGRALFEAGRNGDALAYLYRSVINPQSGEVRQPSSVIDTGSALSMIADIHRQQGEFERMDETRATQEHHLQSAADRARWAYSRALDKVVSHGATSDNAVRHLREAQYIAGNSGETAWRNLAQLRLCSARGARDSACSEDNASRLFQDVLNSGSNRQEAEAYAVYSALLFGRGNYGRAAETSYRLLEQLSQVASPGPQMLGAWFLEWRQSFFTTYLESAIRMDGSDRNAESSWLAINRLRFVESGIRGHRSPPTKGSLSGFSETLPGDSAALTYFFSANRAYAWLVTSTATRRIELADPSAIAADLDSLRREIKQGEQGRVADTLARLGRRVVLPLGNELPEFLFLGAHGPLLDAPFDALTVGGTPVSRRTRVIHVASFSRDAHEKVKELSNAPENIFLAGDPTEFTAEYPAYIQPSEELRAVTARFVGSGLHLVQGIALLRDEFETSTYNSADLLHLAVPATVDLRAGGLSFVELSEAERNSGRQTIDSEHLAQMPVNARLAVLSRTTFEGTATSLENERGAVDSMLIAGAGAVIASLWGVDDASRATFAAGFYANLNSSENLSEALWLTKNKMRDSGSETDWAAFQLFLD